MRQSTVSTVQVVQRATAVRAFPTELPWTSHRIYTNRFSQDYLMKRSRVLDTGELTWRYYVVNR